MRLRAIAALSLAALPLAISCSSGEDPEDGGVGGGLFATGGIGTGVGGNALGAGGGAQDGIGGDGAPGAGGGVQAGLGGSATDAGGSTASSGGAATSSGGVTASSGGATTNAGGETNAGGSTESSGGSTSSGGSNAGTDDYSVEEGGFVTVCGWSGYAWANADDASRIEPTGFDSLGAGDDLCASGSVAAEDTWGGYAMVGINVAQEAGEDTSIGTLVPDGTGIYVDLMNAAGNELRIQIQDAEGEADENHRWCAVYSEPGVIPWSDFNTHCWDGTGNAYNGEAINAVLVMVPGHNENAVDFDFCINSLEPSGSDGCEGGSNPGTGGASGNTGGASGNTGGSTSSDCTDDPNPDEPGTPCSTWAEWNQCGEPWMIENHICDRTCGRCSGGGSGGSGSGTGGSSNGSGGQNNDITLPALSNPQNGWMTRYWDCCKPHCAWSGNGPAVASCDANDTNRGVNDERNACEDGGTSYMCHSFAPWSVNDQVAYGFVARMMGTFDRDCGSCYLVEFTGSSSRGVAQPSIAGKRMIVQMTNTGGLQANEQLDLLVPGGGVGANNACSRQWGVDNSQLGAQYGGFKTVCGEDSNCILDMCRNAFGDSSELMRGCEWYVNWLHAADNPDIRFEPIQCPQEIRSVSGIG